MISIQPFHTFGLQARVEKLIDITTENQLQSFIDKKIGKDFILLGDGSNSVFLDDFSGPALIMKLKGIEIVENSNCFKVTAKAGENWHQFVQLCLEKGIYGLENLALIPGSVGACPVQNIGAYGVEVNKFIDTVNYYDLVDGAIKSISNEKCEFSYRCSIFKKELRQNAIITSVEFTFPKAWAPVLNYGELAELNEPTANDVFEKVIAIRSSKLPDPAKLGNAGSFFKNPIVSKEKAENLKQVYDGIPVYNWSENESKVAAGWLIDKAGLKGLVHKSVAIHDKQALVLVNHSGEAKSEDLIELIRLIIDAVSKKFGVELVPEVRLFHQGGESSFNEICRDVNRG